MSSNNVQQQQPQQPTGAPGLDPSADSFVPRVPAGPLPVDLVGRSSLVRLHGGEMIDAHTFVTARGNRISRAHGHHLQLGRTGSGPYPRIDEVREQ